MFADIATEKQQIRNTLLTARGKLSGELRAAHNAMITNRLLQMPEYLQAESVLGYMNFGSEYASELWVTQVLKQGKRLALPKVNRHTNHLDLYWVEDLESQLAIGSWGVREPITERCQRISSLNEVEFALLPGVAFTRCGSRLGYGGGYYDKLLYNIVNLNSTPILVAAAFGLQLVEQLPQEKTDIKVDWIITELGSFSCQQHGFNEGVC